MQMLVRVFVLYYCIWISIIVDAMHVHSFLALTNSVYALVSCVLIGSIFGGCNTVTIAIEFSLGHCFLHVKAQRYSRFVRQHPVLLFRIRSFSFIAYESLARVSHMAF